MSLFKIIPVAYTHERKKHLKCLAPQRMWSTNWNILSNDLHKSTHFSGSIFFPFWKKMWRQMPYWFTDRLLNIIPLIVHDICPFKVMPFIIALLWPIEIEAIIWILLKMERMSWEKKKKKKLCQTNIHWIREVWLGWSSNDSA